MSRWTIFLSCRYSTAGKWNIINNVETGDSLIVCKKVTNLPKSVQQSRLHPSQSGPEWRESLKSSISFKIRFSLCLYTPLFSRTAHPQTSVQTPKKESSSFIRAFDLDFDITKLQMELKYWSPVLSSPHLETLHTMSRVQDAAAPWKHTQEVRIVSKAHVQ